MTTSQPVKRYRLLKDIHTMDLTAKAGEMGESKPSEFYDESCKVWFDNGRYFFYLSQIKQFPDWFEELHKCKYCECWTSQPDEQCYNYPSKVPPLTDTNIERIEVNVLPYGGNGMMAYCTSKHKFPKDKFHAIKILIEGFLNNEFRIHADQTWSVHSQNQKTFIQSELPPPNDTNISKEEGEGEKFWQQVQNFCDKEMDKYAGKKYSQSEVDTIRKETWDAARNAFRVQIPNGGLGYGDIQFKYPTLEDYLKSVNEK